MPRWLLFAGGSLFMQKISRLLFLFLLVIVPAAAQGPRKLGEVRIEVDVNTIPVRISSNSPDLQALALTAFNAHGRYRLVASGQAYDIAFTAATTGPQVRVDITKGPAAAPVASQVLSGTTPRHALLRAADFAVEKTNGLNLRGFFTARLAFIVQRAGKGEVYASDLFLKEAKQVTHDNAHVLTPRWSPDGARIIYTSFFKTGAPDIFLLEPSTGRKETFASFRGMNSGARFSPSGRQVAMVLSGTGASEIYVADAQGRRPERRTRSDVTKSSPCWSPDGTQILFAMDPGPQLYVMPAAGGAPRRLSTSLGTYVAEPDWSHANPNKIACTVRSGTRYQIAVYDLATGKGQIVSKADFDGIEPSWLGDGRHLVYTARDRSTSVLSMLDTETGRSTRISPPDSSALQAGVWLAP